MKNNFYYQNRVEILNYKQGDFEDWHTLVARWHNDHRAQVLAAIDAGEVDKQQAAFIQWANHKTREEIERG